MSTLTEFCLFPELPFELRLKIWAEFLSTPRDVTVSRTRYVARGKHYAKSFESSSPVPVLLHVCQESRNEALSLYKPLFKTDTSPKYTYMSFTLDALKCSDSILEHLREEEMKGVQRLKLDVSDYLYFAHFHMDILKKMTSLKEIELVTDYGLVRPSWHRSYAEKLSAEFEEAKQATPNWECPVVKIISRSSGEQVGLVEGGALDPDWTPESDQLVDDEGGSVANFH